MITTPALSPRPARAVALFGIILALTPSGIGASTPLLFLPPLTYDAGGAATAVVVGDVNGDDIADLVVALQNDPGGAHLSNGRVGVLLGNGDGTYGAPTTYDSAGMDPWSLAIGDLDADGNRDIVVANYCVYVDNSCSITTLGLLLGHGDGTFDPAVPIELGGNSTSSVAIADVNNDGLADIVATLQPPGFGGTSVEILLGNGDATFRPPVFAPVGGNDLRSVAVGDVNGDGAPDLVLTGDTSGAGGLSVGTISVLLANGDGTFQPAVSYDPGVSPGGWANGVTLADVNRDGNLDVAVANYPDATIGVLLGNGDGTFRPVVLYGSGAIQAWSLAAADLNGDGTPDIAVGNFSGVVGVLLGRGDGTFEAAQPYAVPGATTSIAAADVNGDGRIDLVVTNGNGTLSVLLNAPRCIDAPPIITLGAAPASVWPATGKMVRITVSGTITGSACGLDSATYAVRDEYGELQPSGPITVNADGSFSFVVQLLASRRGSDFDGRQYTITVQAESAGGQASTATTTVTVLHDRGR